MPIKNQLLDVIDILPEAEQALLLEIARRFLPDNIATPDDLEAHKAAIEEYANGETVPHEAINWN